MLGGNRLCVQLWARPSTLLCSSPLICEMGLIRSLERTRRGAEWPRTLVRAAISTLTVVSSPASRAVGAGQ